MSSYRMEGAVQSNRSELMKLDIKCYDYSYTFEEWGEILVPTGLRTAFCEVFKKNNTILGYYVYLDKHPLGENDLFVSRLGVRPNARNQGIGSMLIDKLRDRARTKGLEEIQVEIPEYFMYEDENRGLQEFVKSKGLLVHSLRPEAYAHYGGTYDGIVYRSGGVPVAA